MMILNILNILVERPIMMTMVIYKICDCLLMFLSYAVSFVLDTAFLSLCFKKVWAICLYQDIRAWTPITSNIRRMPTPIRVNIRYI